MKGVACVLNFISCFSRMKTRCLTNTCHAAGCLFYRLGGVATDGIKSRRMSPSQSPALISNIPSIRSFVPLFHRSLRSSFVPCFSCFSYDLTISRISVVRSVIPCICSCLRTVTRTTKQNMFPKTQSSCGFRLPLLWDCSCSSRTSRLRRR